jgi:chromosome segregation ATPase
MCFVVVLFNRCFNFFLQNNIYVDDSGDHADPSSLPSEPKHFKCDLCEEGQDASLTCSSCKTYFCTRCRSMHDKLCKSGDVKEIESKGDGGMMTDVKKLSAALDQVLKRMSELEQTVSKQETLIAGLQNQNTLLSHDVRATHEKNAQLERQLQGKKERGAAAPSGLEQEMKSLKDKVTILCQENQQIHNDVAQVKDTMKSEQEKLGKEQASMKQDISRLQADQHQMKTTFNDTVRSSAHGGSSEQGLKDLKDKLQKQVAFHVIKTGKLRSKIK